MKNCHSPQSRVCIFLSFDKIEGHAYLAVLLRWCHINCLKLLSVTYAESSKSSKQEPYFKDCNIYSLQNLKNNIGCLALGVFSRHSILLFQVQAYLCIFLLIKKLFCSALFVGDLGVCWKHYITFSYCKSFILYLLGPQRRIYEFQTPNGCISCL